MLDSVLPARQSIVSKSYTEYELDVYPGGKVHTYSSNGTTGYDEGINAYINSSFPESDWVPGKWYHLVWTLSGTHEIIYINGVNIGEYDKAHYGTIPGTHSLNVGRRSGGGLEFNGTIDEVGVWDRAIEDWEVSWLYNYRYGLERTSYDPLGNILIGGDNTRFNYEGKENDKMTGQVDFHSRQYNPRRGQHGQADTIIQNIYDPQNLNRYAFESNSPYNRVDPSGHVTCSIWSGCLRIDLLGFKIYLGGALDETDVTVKTVTTNSDSQIKLVKSSANNEEGQWITDLFIGAGTIGTSIKPSVQTGTSISNTNAVTSEKSSIPSIQTYRPSGNKVIPGEYENIKPGRYEYSKDDSIYKIDMHQEISHGEYGNNHVHVFKINTAPNGEEFINNAGTRNLNADEVKALMEFNYQSK